MVSVPDGDFACHLYSKNGQDAGMQIIARAGEERSTSRVPISHRSFLQEKDSCGVPVWIFKSLEFARSFAHLSLYKKKQPYVFLS